MSNDAPAPEIVLFCGSRDWSDRESIRRDLESLPPDSVIVEGGARGADRIAREEAHGLGIHVATMGALWDYYDRGAGFRRNEAMARLGLDYAYAYPLGESRGTRHMIRTCEGACVPVRER